MNRLVPAGASLYAEGLKAELNRLRAAARSAGVDPASDAVGMADVPTASAD
nr:hypothetical protein [Propionibacterium sp.]